MSADVPATLRKQVFARAGGRCEYCLLPQSASVYHHEPDHIIPIQHGGETESNNLALACMRCNRHKGPNVGSFDPETGELVTFFNPRAAKWRDHFRLDGATIRALTPQGRVSIKILRLNDSDRVEERERLIALGVYVA
ncbi:MAG: HNH endonuclease [Chloroflexi bacterium]|nr:HNH endonuclease [Chloroflexota bacterium]